MLDQLNSSVHFDDMAPDAKQEIFPSFAGVDATSLSGLVEQKIDWLVEWVFGADQPTVFGAASKALKTTQLVDLAVALATSTKWLNQFEVSKQRKVLFITGESSDRAIAKRIQRAIESRELSWGDLLGNLHIEAANFPQLPNPGHRMGIETDVQQHDFEVIIIDPLYRGLSGVDAYRMAEVGQAIVQFVQSCRPASVIISHHVTKSAAKQFEVPTLEDLSGAGLAESCGNVDGSDAD